MTFAQPWLLALALAGPIAFTAWAWSAARGRRRALDVSRLGAARPPYAGALLLAVAGVLAAIAAAGPRWDEREASVPRSGGQVIFVLDVSRSMAARDVEPDRLDAAKAALNASLRRLAGDRVGLVIFGGSARLRAPLTADFEAARQIISSLQPGPVLVTGGSDASLGLDLALRAFDPESDSGRLIVLVTDGDDLGGDPAGVAERIRAAGVDLIVAGVGTTAGGTIPVVEGRNTAPTEKKDANGIPIVTKLNEVFLRALAVASGGRYAGGDVRTLPGIVEGRVAALKRTQFENDTTTFPVERAHWFAIAAIIAVVLATFAERLPRFGRRTALGALGMALLTLVSACATPAHDLNADGLRAYHAGDFAGAADFFVEAQAEKPNEAAISINLATALHAQKLYDEAALAARRALASTSPKTRGRAQASLGHHRFAQGDLPGALDAFKQALVENPQDDASRRDYEVVLRLLRPNPPSPGDPDPNATPTPDSDPGQPGGTPALGPSPSSTPEPGAGAQPGQGQPGDPGNQEAAERRLAELDRQIAALTSQPGDQPTAAEAIEILKLLAERSRIAALRDSFGRGGNPRDY